jgi:VCBS repeat-containing protein
LSGTLPNVTYTPNTHVNGSDSFTFVANDGTADSNVAAVAITITAVNDAPVAANQSLNATAGTPLAITLAASDADGTSLTYRVIGNPAQGTLSGTAPNLTYTPLASAGGSDSFTFRANDGGADSNTATVSINITPAGNTSPIALIPGTGWRLVSASSQETIGEDGRAILSIDGDPDTFWHSQWSGSVAAPPHEIRIDLGKSESIQGFRYLPRQDGGDNGNIGRYEFHVSGDGINWGSPVASGNFANDPAEKEVLFTATSGRYILLRAFEDAGGNAFCCVAELRLLQGPGIDVTPPPNVAPVATAQSVSTPEDKAVAIRLTASDANGDPLGFLILSQPTMGTLSGSAPNLTYTPHADANGSDSFTFRANDGTADSNTATVSIAVNAVNDAPVARSQEVVTLEDKSVGIFLDATDKEGDSLGYNVVAQPAKGKLSGTAPNLTYIPNRDANGSDSFTFVSNDGTIDSAIATVSIVITPVNDAPVAAARFVSTDADKSAVIVLSASDKDGDELSYAIVSQPLKGVLSGTPPRVTYTPHPGAEGTDSLSFRAHDGTLNSNTASISITLVAVVDPNANEAPEFQFEQIRRAQAKVGEEYTSAPLAGTAIDPDGDKLIYSRSSGPEWLTVAADGSISGTPTEGSEGINNFMVRATDAEGAYAEASLEIEVVANDLPLPWTLASIGTVHEQSEASGDALALRLLSSGVLAGTADSGLFAWQTLSGDGEITVRIRELENTDTATRIGLMIRESLAPNSKHTFIGTDGRGYVRWIRRTKTAGSTSTSSVAVTAPLGLWLRLNREGTTVSAFTSSNGSDWTRVGRVNVDLGTTCYFGLSAHSGADDKLSAAVFENITVTP